MHYPRLVQKYGKEYARQAVLNPRVNVSERSHAIVGNCTTRTREGYKRGWRRSMQERQRPLRNFNEASFGEDEEYDGSRFKNLKRIRKNVAKALSSIRTPQLCESYEVGELIGVGREGTVRPCWSIMNRLKGSALCSPAQETDEAGKKAAVKSLDKMDSYSQWRGSGLRREVDVLQALKPHPNIIHLFNVYESPIKLHIVLQMCEGGDLFSYLSEKNFEKQDEKEVARVVLKILTAVCAIQEQGYVHRDIKLENIMRIEEGDKIDAGEIVLIDFGHAKKMPEGEMLSLGRPVGSPSYAAPEVVLNKEFYACSDVWSVGVVLYILLQGYLPFPHLQRKRWREFDIDDYVSEENDPFCYEGDWENISSSAKAFTESLLQADPRKRPSVHEAMNHPWFREQGYTVERNADDLPVVATETNNNFTSVQNLVKSKFSFM
mmetsp:Transcript_2175/g.2469  ORF Transcript_2175/g.2469 Transcript_2175/m.2469 type:complete len:434 (-) Transcript_2175:41-1342(-)|eukprot:CAMPEP_0184064200 /NCGR_PEP_ID=MMETSP0957-20130417/1769_1 /TAXON_ID=627963 /ORGANISM="Aplanochytrium sp, Strain PBS07" /LENGTH=433 /DNA_ID=CAMNT_0026361485 /DNA_START=202 /DNA_END=1503 /DNA_ORIENTATION=+